MSKNRINRDASISLFSFQDIITCLSGIMILLVLLLCVDIITQKILDATPSKASPSRSLPNETDEFPISDTLFIDPIEASRAKVEQDILSENIDKATMMRDGLRAHHHELLNKLNELESSFNSLSKDQRIAFIPEKGSNLAPVLVECSGKTIRLGGINNSKISSEQFSTDQDGQTAFIHSIKNLNKFQEYIVFLIKPSGVGYAMDLISKVKSIGFDVGYDTLIETEHVSF